MSYDFKAYVSQAKNFIHFRDEDTVKSKTTYVRWGWFEDNIISKYTAMVGTDTNDPKITFRSLVYPKDTTGQILRDGNKVSTYCTDYYLIKPINLGHSLIFKSTGLYGSTSGKGVEGYNAGVLGMVMASVNQIICSTDDDRPSRQFDVTGVGVKEATDASNSVGTGKVRNIYVNVDKIQKAFGIDMKNIGNPDQDNYYSSGINPQQSIRNGILNIMGQVSNNFFNMWNWDLRVDPENPKNNILVDNGHQGLSKYSYTRYAEDVSTEIVSDVGVYKFPSFKVSSLVKNQELDMSVGANMAYLAFMGNTTYNTVASSNRDIQKFQEFAQVQRLNIDMNEREDGGTNLSKAHLVNPKAGYVGGEEASKFTTNANMDHYSRLKDANVTWKKYTPAPDEPASLGTRKAKVDRPIDKRSIDWRDGKFVRVANTEAAKVSEKDSETE